MSPKPIIDDSKRDYDHNDERASDARIDYRADDPLNPARGIIVAFALMMFIFIALGCALVIWTQVAKAREGASPQPVAAPQALLRARKACPLDKPLACRAALVHAYTAIQWQRGARQHAKATTVREITLDAINWAADRYHVSAIDMIRVGTCESHLWPFATNGQYAGWAQLSSRHRSDPIFSVVPWQDAYATASHVARYVKEHGWGEWQCTPSGGLRW